MAMNNDVLVLVRLTEARSNFYSSRPNWLHLHARVHQTRTDIGVLGGL
jgi:3-phenylpropionate/cinnamic acid dioxygenase small subunit